jgi:glucose/mannose transport system substrate-binding protein
MKYRGDYVAVPVNVHRVNWMWGNAAVLKQAGIARPPKTWDEFFDAAEKVKAMGLIPIAHGGQNWQDFTTFETVVLGVGGPEFYKDAFIRLSPEALNSETMKRSLETFRRIKSYTDTASPGRDWNRATAMVIQEKAAFQFMGDWAKGEFTAAGKRPGKDYFCAAAPGTADSFTFNVDSFAMFKLKDANAQQAQVDLASTLMGTQFQEVFNLNKGSIPVRSNTDMSKFDDCAKLSAKDYARSAESRRLLPSVAHGMAIRPSAEGAIKDAVSRFWNDDRISVDDGVRNIARAAATR